MDSMSDVQEQVAIVGDGQMGLVLGALMVEQGQACRLWGYFEHEVAELASTRRSPRLTGFDLPDAVEVTADAGRLLQGATIIVNCIPTQFIRPVGERLGDAPPEVPVVSVSKGIENETLLRPTQVIADVTGDEPMKPRRPMCALSGPTIAAEPMRATSSSTPWSRTPPISRC